jgi:hypothetical protein
MLNLHRPALLTALALLVVGCSGHGNIMKSTELAKVEIGMDQKEVLAIMGEPQRRETYGSTEFLIYPGDDGDKTALLDYIPIAIVDGRVTGLGRNLYNTVVRSKTQADLNSSQRH